MSGYFGVTPDDWPAARKADEPVERNAAMDAIVAGARVNDGVTGMEAVALSPQERTSIRERVRRYLDEKGKAQAALAKGIGEPPSTVSQVLSGTYPEGKGGGVAKSDEILYRLDRFISDEAGRERAPKPSGFAWTSVANDIKGVATFANEISTMAVVVGSAGIGKTLCCEALLSIFPGSIMVTASDVTRTASAFLAELAVRMKMTPRGQVTHDRRRVVSLLHDSHRLLIVDEAHLLAKVPLNTIRQLHDETKIPVLLVGLPALTKLLQQGRGDDSSGATLYSRVGMYCDLEERCRAGDGEPLYGIDDIRKVFAKSLIRITHDGFKWLSAVANIPEEGGLRRAARALVAALCVAQRGGKGADEIGAKELNEACRLLLGSERSRSIAAQIEHRARVA